MFVEEKNEHDVEEISLARKLKINTGTVHDSLDKTIMTKRPFASVERYGLFLEIQYSFHLKIAKLYETPELVKLFPDLPIRQRLSQIEKDLSYVNVDLSAVKSKFNEEPNQSIDYPASLGWLYVSEGSNLGAEYLLKAAKRINLSEDFGASHLAPASEGRGQSWKTFTDVLNSINLSTAEQNIAINGARDAFSYVHSVVNKVFK